MQPISDEALAVLDVRTSTVPGTLGTALAIVDGYGGVRARLARVEIENAGLYESIAKVELAARGVRELQAEVDRLQGLVDLADGICVALRPVLSGATDLSDCAWFRQAGICSYGCPSIDPQCHLMRPPGGWPREILQGVLTSYQGKRAKKPSEE